MRGETLTSGVKAISLEDKGLRAKNTGFGILTHAITGWNGNHLTGANVLTPFFALDYFPRRVESERQAGGGII